MDCLYRWAMPVLALAAMAVASVPAIAQTARSGGNANAQLMEQMQQLASERTTLQAENERLKSQLADVTKDRDALKSGQQALDRRARDAAAALAHSNAQRDSSDQELTQTRAKMQELIGKFRETIQKMRDVETESTTTKQTLAAREHELSVCVDRNVALYHLNDEILTHMDHQGFWSHVAEAEPFTKIKRIQNENLIDDYRARAQDQRVKPPQGLNAAPATSPPATPPPATPPSAGAPTGPQAPHP
jgi:chromosome segregation ATPase